MIHLQSFTAVVRKVQPQAGHDPHLTAQGGLRSRLLGQRWVEKPGLARIGVPRWFHCDSGSARAHTNSHRSSHSADTAPREVEAGHDGGTRFSSAVGHRRRLLALAAAGRSQPIGAEGGQGGAQRHQGGAGAPAGPRHTAQAPWACSTIAMTIVRGLQLGRGSMVLVRKRSLVGHLLKNCRLMAIHWKNASKHSWSKISWTTKLLGS